MELLAEPREHVSYREIERVCRVGGDTVKAVERAEAATIAERKAEMRQQVTRPAEPAWQTVDDKLDSANLAQAVICAGVATEKMLLLADQPTAPTRPRYQARRPLFVISSDRGRDYRTGKTNCPIFAD